VGVATGDALAVGGATEGEPDDDGEVADGTAAVGGLDADEIGDGAGEQAARNAATPPTAIPRRNVRRETAGGVGRGSIARQPTPAAPIRP
jgi:hypothetical protein